MASANPHDRAKGALLGLALGDALGMPTQTLTRDQIYQSYGRITGFTTPITGHPVSHGLTAAQITDDTEQTLLLAEQLISSPDNFDEQAWARKLIDWEEDVKKRGMHDLLGPSSKTALLKLLDGTPVSQTGINGTTNGAAMRICPVGISMPVEPIGKFVDSVERSCRITHNTAVAISSAAAVAAVVSAGVDGADLEQANSLALGAAREGQERGGSRRNYDIVTKIEHAIDLAETLPIQQALQRLVTEIGTGVASDESIPTAFGIAKLVAGDAWHAGLISANLGGDTDTIGAIAAAMVGACNGFSALPSSAVAELVETNNLHVDSLVDALLTIRGRQSTHSARLENAV